MKENYQDDDEHLDSEENLSAYKGKVKVSGLELALLAPIVQLVERSTENGKVVGSNPTRGIYIQGVVQLVERWLWESEVAGSIPVSLIAAFLISS